MSNNNQAMNVLLNCSLKFRYLDVDMTVLTMSVFLTVAKEDGILVADIIEQVRSNKSSVSRVLAMLSDIGRREKAGLGLVRAVEDPVNRRNKRVYLTDEGVKLVNSVAGTLNRGCKKIVEG